MRLQNIRFPEPDICSEEELLYLTEEADGSILTVISISFIYLCYYFCTFFDTTKHLCINSITDSNSYRMSLKNIITKCPNFFTAFTIFYYSISYQFLCRSKP